jgi:hypothetical protein
MLSIEGLIAGRAQTEPDSAKLAALAGALVRIQTFKMAFRKEQRENRRLKSANPQRGTFLDVEEVEPQVPPRST